MKKVSIIIAIYNERDSLLQVLDKIKKVKIPLEKEIIIVDDGSNDRTAYGQVVSSVIKQKNIKSLIMLPSLHLLDYDIVRDVFFKKKQRL